MLEVPGGIARVLGMRDAAAEAARIGMLEAAPRVAGVVAGAGGLVATFRTDHPVLLYLARLAPSSRPTQAGALRDAARWFGQSAILLRWHELTPAQVAALRSWTGERYAPSTANRILCALRGVLRACVSLRLLSRDAAAELGEVAAKVGGSRELRGRAIDGGELEALFGALDETEPIGQRDAAILALLYGCGLRRAEVAALDIDHLGAEGLRVRGKGNKERIVPLPGDARARIDRWLFARGVLTGSRENRALFCHSRGAGRLGPRGIYLRVVVLARLAGVRPISPHDLRRSYCSDLLDRGADLHTVQELMGHSDPVVTARYDRRPARARAQAVEVLRLPEPRRDHGESTEPAPR